MELDRYRGLLVVLGLLAAQLCHRARLVPRPRDALAAGQDLAVVAVARSCEPDFRRLRMLTLHALLATVALALALRFPLARVREHPS